MRVIDMRRLAAALLLLTMVVGLAANAEAASCAVPDGVMPASPTAPPADQVVRGVAVTHYVFALTWAPEWCRVHAREPESVTECADRSRAFVVHGLWPNGDHKPYPRFCGDAPAIDLTTFRKAWCLSPSAFLLQHEWAAHGTCAWHSAADFFAQEAKVRDSLVLPDLDRMPTPIASAGDIRAAMVRANAGLDPRAVAVEADRKQRLTEIHVCYALDFKPTPCIQGETGAPDAVPVRVTPRA